jgi:lysophospholipase L1-like esterase
MSVQLKRNDTKDTITYTITNLNGSVVNLTGASVKFVMGKNKTLITNAAATIVNATAGEVSYTLTETDTLVSGVFNAEFEVTFSNGKIKTYPSDGYIMVKIQANIDKDQSTYIADQIAYRVSDIQVLKNSIQTQLDEFAKGATNAETSQARVEADGTTNATLKARLDKKETKFASDIASLSSSLAQKANQEEVRLKSVKVEPEDWSERALALATGQGTINLLSIPQDGSVTPEKTTFVQNSVNLFNKTDPSIVLDYYIMWNGTVSSASGYYIAHPIYVTPGEQITFRYAETSSGACYDENDVFLSKIGTVSGTSSPFTFTVPANTSYIKLNGKKTSLDVDMVVKGATYPSSYVGFSRKLNNEFGLNETQKQDVNNTMSNFSVNDSNLVNIVTTADSINLIDETKKTSGYYLSGGTLTAATGYWTTDFIPAVLNDVIRYTYDDGMGTGHTVKCYDSNKTYLGSTTLGTLDSNSKYREATITVANTAYTRVSYRDSKLGVAMVVKNTEYPAIYQAYQIIKYFKDGFLLNNTQKTEVQKIAQANPLNGKIVSFNGDSICAGAGFVGGYGKIIAERNAMTYQNIGVGGGTITGGTLNTGGTNRHWISRTIANMRSDADYIVLEGGVNDASLGVPLGTITPDYTSALDDTTFCGAFENMLKQAIDRFPGKKIGFVLVHYMTSSQNQYNPYSIQILEKWGIPYINLFKECPPLNFIPYLKTNYTFEGDGWHPNELGYKKYYCDKIEAFMKSL